MAAGKGVRVDSHLLEHREIKAAEGLVVSWIEGEVLAMLEFAAGKEDGEVVTVVYVGIAHIAAVQNHGGVEQGAGRFTGLVELLEQPGEGLHLAVIRLFELPDFLR